MAINQLLPNFVQVSCAKQIQTLCETKQNPPNKLTSSTETVTKKETNKQTKLSQL